MAWLIWRELVVMTRTTALWLATAMYVTTLALFLAIWGEGVPVLRGSVFEQFSLVQLATFAVVAPWIACRAMPVENDARRVAALAAVTGSLPARVLVARTMALVAGLAAMSLTALPFAIIAIQVSSSGRAPLAALFASCWSLGALTAATATAFAILTRARLMSWLLCTATTLLSLSFVPHGRWMAICPALAVVITIAFASHGNRTLRYVPPAAASA